MKNLKSFVKQCIAEVVVEPTDEGKLASLAMAGLLGMGAMKAAQHTQHHGSDDAKPRIHMADPTKELPSEKGMDGWDLANKYSSNKEKTAKGLQPLMKMTKFIKECIAEVIVEPHPRKKKVYGNPRRLQAAHLIKECIMEVLKENLLSEAFDPTSQGPNIATGEAPYQEWNAKMARMEEGELQRVCMHCKRSMGTKHVDGPSPVNASHGICRDCWDIHYKAEHGDFPEEPTKTPTVEGGNKSKADAWKRYEKGYSAGEAHKRSGQKPKGTLDNVESIGYHDALKGKAKASPDVVRKTVREGDPHGRYAQQAGAMSFEPPHDTSIVEDQDPEAIITKVRKEVYVALAKEGFQPHGDEPRDYVEYYLNGFVTVQVSVGYDSKAARVERYYDNEMVNNMPGHNVVRSFPVPVPYSPSFVQKFIKYAIALKRAGEGDESLFGGFDDIEEGQRTQSTSVQWSCPHCGELTDIDVEIESPSDYIACADCEHCGKEISDPKLDQQVYQAVINHYSGKADHLKDTSMQEVKKVVESFDAKSIGKSVFGPAYDSVNTDIKPDGATYYTFQVYNDPAGKYNKFLVQKDGLWYWAKGSEPEKLRKLVGINPPASKKPKIPNPPRPPKERRQFNLVYAVQDLASKSSGNQELDDRINQAGLNAREATVVRMNHLGYSNSQIGRLLKIRTSRVRTVLEVAWRLLRQPILK